MTMPRLPGEPVEGPGSYLVPWLPASFLERFNSWDTKDWTLFEWGAGYSTLWFAKRVRTVVSVEHDPAWRDRIMAECRKRRIKNVDLRLATMDPVTREAADPQAVAGEIAAFAATLPGGKVDCAFIDGEARNLCVEAAIPVTRRVIVWDNASRGEFEPGRERLYATDWVLRVEQFAPGHPKHDQADTWYWCHPDFKAGYEGLPPSPHTRW